MTQQRRGPRLSRPLSPLVAQRHDALLERIRARQAEPPCWGDRRMGADLRCVERFVMNKKRSLRLLREQHLLVGPPRHLNAKWTPTGRPTTPHPTPGVGGP